MRMYWASSAAHNICTTACTSAPYGRASDCPQWTKRVSELSLKRLRAATDYPRGYSVSTSLDRTTWSDPVVGTGSGQLTHIALGYESFRYVRIDQTGTAQRWWSVADLRVYARRVLLDVDQAAPVGQQVAQGCTVERRGLGGL